jgi:outer membrane cobalamin receptor
MRDSLIILMLLFIAAGPVYPRTADTLDTGMPRSLHVAFDDIVVTATRTRIPVWKSPVPVTLISGIDIERRGGVTLGDVLERSEPLTLSRYGPGAALTTMSLRGIAADQTVILLNGIQINSPQNGLVDLSTIPLSGIQRIEIARGGASSLYGNHAMGGVVNIITHSAEYDRPAIDLQVGGGSFGLRRINVQSQFTSSSFDVSFGLGRDQADGDFKFTDSFNGNDDYVRENADYVLSFAWFDGLTRLDGGTTLRLFARYSDADRGLPGPFFGQQSNDRQEDEHVHTAAVLTHMVGDDVMIEFRPFLIYSDMVYESPEWEYRSRSINRQYGAAFDVNTQISSSFSLTFGGEISDARVDADDLAGEVDRVNTVAYASGEWNIPPVGRIQTTLFPSIRYDRFSNNHAGGDRRLYEEVTWKLGATVQPFTFERFLFRGSVGRNFKAPGLNDMYWMPGGNTDLVPERSLGYDAGIRWDVPLLHGLLVDAGVFSMRIKDRIIWMPDEENWFWSPVNLRKVHADGFEFDLRWKPEHIPMRFGVSYTYQHVRQFITDETTGRESERQLPFVPNTLITGEIGYEIADVSMTIFPRYNSKRYTTETGDDYVNGFVLFDIRSDYDVDLGTISALVSFDVKNILNKEYQVIQYFPMPGRQYELTVRLQY